MSQQHTPDVYFLTLSPPQWPNSRDFCRQHGETNDEVNPNMSDANRGRRRAGRVCAVAARVCVWIWLAIVARALAGQAGAAPPGPGQNGTGQTVAAGAAMDAGSLPPAGAALPKFEVVSVRPNKSDRMQMGIRFTADGAAFSGIPLHMMLREAFNVSDDRLIVEPEWVKTARFDIEAKVAPEDMAALKGLKGPGRFAMLLPVFEERFGLKFHHETRDLTVYTLVVAKGGPKLTVADPNNTYPNGVKPPEGASGAGLMRMGPGDLLGQGVSVAMLVQQLSTTLGGKVVDKTGLTGKYDFDLKFEPDEVSGSKMSLPDGGAAPGMATPPPSGGGPSLFAALDEQLGLKLEAHKEPTDVIVIDHIEQPTAN